MTAQGVGSQVFELRPLNIADLLDAVIRIYRRRFGELIAITAVVLVPLGVLQSLSASYIFVGEEFAQPYPTLEASGILGLSGLGIWVVLLWLTTPLMQAAVAKAVSEHYLGGRSSVRAAYGFALQRWGTLLMVAILLGLVTMLAMGVCIVPVSMAVGTAFATGWDTPQIIAVVMLSAVGLLAMTAGTAWLGTKLFFGALVVILERPLGGRLRPHEDTLDEGTRPFFLLWWLLGVWGAVVAAVRGLLRSWDLTNGHFWRVLGTLGLLYFIVLIAQGILVWPAQFVFAFLQTDPTGPGIAIIYALSTVAQLVCQPLLIIGTVLLYYDLRIRKEGFDLAMMAEAIGEPERAPRAPSGEARAPLFGQPGAESEAAPPRVPPAPPMRPAAPEPPAPPSAYRGRPPPPPPPREPGPDEETVDEP